MDLIEKLSNDNPIEIVEDFVEAVKEGVCKSTEQEFLGCLSWAVSDNLARVEWVIEGTRYSADADTICDRICHRKFGPLCMDDSVGGLRGLVTGLLLDSKDARDAFGSVYCAIARHFLHVTDNPVELVD